MSDKAAKKKAAVEQRNANDETRKHPRLPLEVEVDVHGYEPEDDRVDAKGVTINVSRGGLLARVERALKAGPVSHCLIRFRDALGNVTPEWRWGTVLRSEAKDDGHEVAVSFNSPLERVRPGDGATANEELPGETAEGMDTDDEPPEAAAASESD